MEFINSQIVTKNMTYSGIYLIINLLNNKFYVGSAVSLNNRKRTHFSNLKNNIHRNIHLQRSYNKNPDKFVMVMIEKVDDKKSLITREQYWIDNLVLNNLSCSYNLSLKAGSMFGYKHTDETKRKISENQKGKILTKEHKDNISKGLRGRIFSDELKEKIKTTKREYFKRTILQFDLDGNFIKEFSSHFEAASELDLKRNHIKDCCDNKRKMSNGYIWRYKDEVENTNKIEPYIKNIPRTEGKFDNIKIYQYTLNLDLLKVWTNIQELMNSFPKKHLTFKYRILNACKNDAIYNKCRWSFN